MLAGVALIEAGVRVLLLLLGVMPTGNSTSQLCLFSSFRELQEVLRKK